MKFSTVVEIILRKRCKKVQFIVKYNEKFDFF